VKCEAYKLHISLNYTKNFSMTYHNIHCNFNFQNQHYRELITYKLQTHYRYNTTPSTSLHSRWEKLKTMKPVYRNFSKYTTINYPASVNLKQCNRWRQYSCIPLGQLEHSWHKIHQKHESLWIILPFIWIWDNVSIYRP